MTALDRAALSAQLAPIRARADAATPGEWTLMPARPDGRVAIERPTYDLFTGEVSKFLLVYDTNPADAAFIAAARTDVPALLAIIDRLTDEMGRREEAFGILNEDSGKREDRAVAAELKVDRLTDALDVADNAPHEEDCTSNWFPSCTCWKSEYEAAKEALS